ncbi:MAG: thioether cross-link-forming SCIFF peptide maturase [Oscillospiraceae bacterium]|jgi:uncharacterized protein|nr:thioether cross-link-forming SCIFF peptide maturase [Oscillospiraceae bacterium]
MIHKYRLNETNFVIDVNSSCVYIVDDIAYRMLDYLDENMTQEFPLNILPNFKDVQRNKLEECYRDLYELKNSHKLFSKDISGLLSSAKKDLPIKSLCLNVAHDCNLRCKYCFASTGGFGQKRSLMSFEVGKKAIDFLIKNSGHRCNLEVDFFGGEPLMNFDVISKIVEYSREIEKEFKKNFRFTITTNGLLLNSEKIDFINQEMSNVVLSLDGRQAINDNLRVMTSGESSYNKILPLFKELVDKRSSDKSYYVRGTFTKHNLDFTEDVLHLANLGFKYISVEPVVCKEGLNYSINDSDIAQIKNEYEKLFEIMIKRHGTDSEFSFFHFFVDLDMGPCAIKRTRGCGSGNEYICVTPEGDIYPCHQFVGKNKWKMGNLLNKILIKNIKTIFSEIDVNLKDDCKNCFAKFHCTGGCNANNLEYGGSLLKVHKIFCALQKKRLECAVALQSLKKLSNNCEYKSFLKSANTHKAYCE